MGTACKTVTIPDSGRGGRRRTEETRCFQINIFSFCNEGVMGILNGYYERYYGPSSV